MQFQKLRKPQINQFSEDYSLERNLKIKEHLVNFDQKLIEIFNFRKTRYDKGNQQLQYQVDNNGKQYLVEDYEEDDE